MVRTASGPHRMADRYRSLYVPLVEHRRAVQFVLDAGVVLASMMLAVALRYELGPPAGTWQVVLAVFPVVALVELALGLCAGLYLGRWSFGSFEEVGALTRTVGATVGLLFALNWSVRLLPASVPLIAAAMALLMMGGVRYAWRYVLEKRRRPRGETCRRLLVFGAGEAAEQLITSLLRDPASEHLPVAVLDDDPRKQNLRIRGVRVRGTRRDLAEVARQVRADSLVIAVPSADGALARDVSRLGGDAGLKVTILPPVKELFTGEVRESDMRPLSESDLLGRHEVETDLVAIAGYLAGKRVLVTGAGGSIGSELCRQIHRLGPESLVMLDRDESGLHGTQLAIEGRALLDTRSLVVCDIRDRDRLDRVFAEHRPQVVFHAAALKHLTLLEQHPCEAVKTNVWGTLNVLGAASAHGVERLVNISTDKAADPTSVLGWTKRVTERLTAEFDGHVAGRYVSVRFGNVLGSRGSVLTAFRRQIEDGGPVTVTHPDVTRFFMTVEEAVQLVIQAGAIGRGGDALVLDMGVPVPIHDVARRLVEQSERPIEIVFTGLRPGEKLHEELFGSAEHRALTDHPLISRVAVPPVSPSAALALDVSGRATTLIRSLEALAVDERTGGAVAAAREVSTA
jgi:FlaA1/EpsC-like NDP-sugar epimerase